MSPEAFALNASRADHSGPPSCLDDQPGDPNLASPDRMLSTPASNPPGVQVSRPVSPKTVPLRSHGTGSSSKQERFGTLPRVDAAMARASSVIPPDFQAPYSAGAHLSAIQSLDPRSLCELHNERSYLAYNLQKQNDRATRLFERFAGVEARLAEAATPSEAKRCRREAALIRSRIAESTRQEQLMLLRLSEIQIELQNRDRWARVRSLPSSYFQGQHHPPRCVDPPPVPPAPPPSANRSFSSDVLPQPRSNACEAPSQCQPRNDENTPAATATNPPSSSVLSPLSPCFTPGVSFIEDIWSRASKTSSAEQGEAKSWSELVEEEEEGGDDEGEGRPRSEPADMKEGVEANENRHGGGDGGGEGSGGELPYQHRYHCHDPLPPSSPPPSPPPPSPPHHQRQQRQQKETNPEERRHAVPPNDPSTHPAPDPDGRGRGRDTSPEEEEEREDMHAWRASPGRRSLFLPIPSRSAGGREGRVEKRMSLPCLKGELWQKGSRRGSAQSMEF
ncbi:hypothetical protein VTJ83DRAFT_4708 [Remersonia thermophila]|uniref:Uncharacterized protein n=1 Tax=Remersonia thermophila TaxID=72144 RepID=A0ABR4DAR4_9PEZI